MRWSELIAGVACVASFFAAGALNAAAEEKIALCHAGGKARKLCRAPEDLTFDKSL